MALQIQKENQVISYYNYQNITYRETSGVIFDMWACGPASNIVVNRNDPLVKKAKICDQKITQYGKTNKVCILRGCFPRGFLRRWHTAFIKFIPENTNQILHVCSGGVPAVFGKRLDISPLFNPDFLCNAEKMTPIKDETFTWAISDTPYNDDAASKYYQKPLVNKSKVLREMARVTKIGGFVGVLDQIFPQGKPNCLKNIARIAVTSVPNLDIRAFTIFQKTNSLK